MAGNEARGIDRTVVKSYVAAADLSSYQYRFVCLVGDNIVNLCGANGKSVGILANKPDAAGKTAEVLSIGSTGKLKISETVAVSKLLTSTAAGLGEVADAAGEFCGAMALQEGVENDIIEVLVVAISTHASDV